VFQVAPGVPKNRPESGGLPLRKSILSENGHTMFQAQTWYEGLELSGNTSINPFFYGTYLAETKPYEPVTRTKKQAFQADAVGVVHQLTPSHFEEPHTFRIEWQPGRGGRIDWFVKSHQINSTFAMEGDGEGEDWTRVFTLKDESLEELMGSQIPIEPSYFIMNTAVSSTWGFPYDVPDWCTKCYDCNNPQCACSFYPGFCKMLESRNTAMYIDSIRLYQSKDDSAHVGSTHTLGCDPPDFPTRDWIVGHEYRYMRNPPFSYADKHPLRRVQQGGGSCEQNGDCGGNVNSQNYTAVIQDDSSNRTVSQRQLSSAHHGRGRCTEGFSRGMFSMAMDSRKSCLCEPGFTGPKCLALNHRDDFPSAYEISSLKSPFQAIANFTIPMFLQLVVTLLTGVLIYFLVSQVIQEKRSREPKDIKESLLYADANSARSTEASI